MYNFFERISNNSKYTKILQWGELISVTGGAQAIVQATGLISGVIVIRLLSTEEYAFYTLANTMLGTMNVLSDGGITAGVISEGGKVWQNREQLGAVLATGFDLRKKFALGVVAITFPLLLTMLLHHGSSWPMAILIVLSVVPSFFMTTSGTIIEIALKLHQAIRPLQKIQVKSNIARVVLLGASIFVLPKSFIAILAAGVPQLWANRQLRSISGEYANWTQASDAKLRSEILKIVKRVLPNSIYYCVSGQITIWLISIFGTTVSIAQVGALGRIAVILTLFNTIFATVILPRFARLIDIPGLLMKRFTQIQVSLLILSTLFIFTVWVFSSEILWILGKNYINLESELILSIIGGCLSLIAGISFSLSTIKGWIINPMISISISLLSIVIGIFLFDISSLNGILIFNIFIAAVQAIMYCTYNYICLSRMKIAAIRNIQK